MLSIDRQSPSASVSEASSVTYAVTFSPPVTGVAAADFSVVCAGGTTAASSVAVTPAGGYNTVYSVTVSGISGHDGTVGLNLVSV